MKTLIVEDDLTSRFLLQEILKEYGSCDIAVNGKEAVLAARIALDADEPYDLICLDIMMPEMDGRAALHELREQETARGILSSSGSKIVMTSAVTDMNVVLASFYDLCDGYIFKPIAKTKLLDELRKLNLIR
jgi:two-component system, chemotaxis family, chemotaxis protein CheY